MRDHEQERELEAKLGYQKKLRSERFDQIVALLVSDEKDEQEKQKIRDYLFSLYENSQYQLNDDIRYAGGNILTLQLKIKHEEKVNRELSLILESINKSEENLKSFYRFLKSNSNLNKQGKSCISNLLNYFNIIDLHNAAIKAKAEVNVKVKQDQGDADTLAKPKEKNNSFAEKLRNFGNEVLAAFKNPIILGFTVALLSAGVLTGVGAVAIIGIAGVGGLVVGAGFFAGLIREAQNQFMDPNAQSKDASDIKNKKAKPHKKKHHRKDPYKIKHIQFSVPVESKNVVMQKSKESSIEESKSDSHTPVESISITKHIPDRPFQDEEENNHYESHEDEVIEIGDEQRSKPKI